MTSVWKLVSVLTYIQRVTSGSKVKMKVNEAVLDNYRQSLPSARRSKGQIRASSQGVTAKINIVFSVSTRVQEKLS
jgi:hypothetical protein